MTNRPGFGPVLTSCQTPFSRNVDPISAGASGKLGFQENTYQRIRIIIGDVTLKGERHVTEIFSTTGGIWSEEQPDKV
jgi:hypothetical protein